MCPPTRLPTADSSESRYVRLLRLVKLLLTVILLALAIWQSLSGGPVPIP